MRILLFAFAFSLVACKGKSSSDPFSVLPQGPAPVPPFVDKITGVPAIDGTWKSGCLQDDWSDNFVIFTITFKDRTVSRGEDLYTDRNCLNFSESRLNAGSFIFAERLDGDIYSVEYRFALANGGYSVSGENLLRTEDRLWISNRRMGAGFEPDIALELVAAE